MTARQLGVYLTAVWRLFWVCAAHVTPPLSLFHSRPCGHSSVLFLQDLRRLILDTSDSLYPRSRIHPVLVVGSASPPCCAPRELLMQRAGGSGPPTTLKVPDHFLESNGVPRIQAGICRFENIRRL